jgi:hypothetical protein
VASNSQYRGPDPRHVVQVSPRRGLVAVSSNPLQQGGRCRLRGHRGVYDRVVPSLCRLRRCGPETSWRADASVSELWLCGIP